MNSKLYFWSVMFLGSHLYASEGGDSFNDSLSRSITASSFASYENHPLDDDTPRALWRNEPESIAQLLDSRIESALQPTQSIAPLIAACALVEHGRRFLRCLGFNVCDREFRSPTIPGMTDDPIRQNIVRHLISISPESIDSEMQQQLALALWTSSNDELRRSLSDSQAGRTLLTFWGCQPTSEVVLGEIRGKRELSWCIITALNFALPLVDILLQHEIGKRLLDILGFNQIEDWKEMPFVANVINQPLRRRVIHHLLSLNQLDAQSSLSQRLALALWSASDRDLPLALAHSVQGRELLRSWNYTIEEQLIINGPGQEDIYDLSALYE